MRSKQIIRTVTVCIFVIALFCSPLYAEVNLSGDLEIDTSYKTTSTDPDTDTTEYDLGSVLVVL